jgi:hypothetical protein
MRTAKLKTPGNIAASIEHTFRERDTPNADLSRTHLNEHHGPSNTADLLAKLNEMIPEHRRKDAVLCVEHFFGASPEWWEKASRDDQAAFFRRAEGWLHDTYGRENVAYFGTQMDEQTPHAVAYVVPLRDGKLNAKSWLGGKERLQGLQASFAESVKDLGLQRGVEGSKAKHDRVQRFYGTLDRADQAVERIKGRTAAKMTVVDRVNVLAGQMPPSVQRELERTHDLVVKARQVIETEGPRREAAGYQKGLKELPAERAKLDADRAALDQQRQSFEAARAAAQERERKEREKLERERTEFERQRTRDAHKVLENLGLTLAERGNEYVGQIVASTQRFALQLTEEFGVVVHQVEKWTSSVKSRIGQAFADGRDLFFGYTNDGKVNVRDATSADLQRSHERAQERTAERDTGYDLER